MMLDTSGPRPLLKKTTQDLGKLLKLCGYTYTPCAAPKFIEHSALCVRFLSWLSFTINMSPPTVVTSL